MTEPKPVSLLRIEGLSVTYGRGRRPGLPALDRVDLEIGRGQTVGLVGESGSGKSTLGGSVLGLTPISGGRIVFDGEDITQVPAAVRRRLSRRIQVVFQDPFGSLNPDQTVGETIGEGLRYGAGVPAAQVRSRVQEVLAEVGLPIEAADRYPAAFSGGQRQRIAIARAVIGRPDLIVCDEPVSALDLSVQAQALNLLVRLKADHGLSYLFISHDLSVVRHLSDEIAVLYAGRIVERGPAAQVATQPVHPYTRALVAAAPVPDPVQQARNRRARRDLISNSALETRGAATSGCRFVHRCPYAVERCHSEDPVLTTYGPGHQVACHRQSEIGSFAASSNTPAPASG
jgi:oligopeptide/dipeptide ABC transporter ATP-binding protein